MCVCVFEVSLVFYEQHIVHVLILKCPRINVLIIWTVQRCVASRPNKSRVNHNTSKPTHMKLNLYSSCHKRSKLYKRECCYCSIFVVEHLTSGNILITCPEHIICQLDHNYQLSTRRSITPKITNDECVNLWKYNNRKTKRITF